MASLLANNAIKGVFQDLKQVFFFVFPFLFFFFFFFSFSNWLPTFPISG